MQSFSPLHPVRFGPGSQPPEDDGAELAYLPMPAEMQTYRPPLLPEPDAVLACQQGLRLLEQLLARLADDRIAEPARGLDLGALPDADRDLVNQALGEGEVSLLIVGETGMRAQETRLTGVWLVQSRNESGQTLDETIEIATIPRRVREIAFQDAAAQLNLDDAPPEGVISARAVLAEVNEQSARWRPGAAPHIINLTLLPQSEQDLSYLERSLGQGPVTILSRGYGKCRIAATGLRHCWWVQHFNADDRLILNTLEIVDVPAAALAAQEDFEDSAERLVEILGALR
ncbi:hydrogenase expression/formation protein [uncultured Thiocystis sp.]|uniref:hydrogenase expression/formation protein n=1 Tax=uncultured Thiocystis sp. TaxID=1202134 RepID=UPI0025DA680E|nr:hydrogenase expression/formation protein [uncultured Thiocystis sp.]